MSSNAEGEKDDVVRVSRKGQATIPKRLRERHGISAPGRVRFRETETGDIVVEPVPHPSDLRGSLRAGTDGDGEVWESLDELREGEIAEERDELEGDRGN